MGGGRAGGGAEEGEVGVSGNKEGPFVAGAIGGGRAGGALGGWEEGGGVVVAGEEEVVGVLRATGCGGGFLGATLEGVGGSGVLGGGDKARRRLEAACAAETGGDKGVVGVVGVVRVVGVVGVAGMVRVS